jgi:hypothetical protein
MTRTIPFPTPAAVALLLALAVIITASPAASANTFNQSDADAFVQLEKSALALHKDINNAMGILGKSRELDQTSCLSELENSLVSIMDGLSSAADLVGLSTQMRYSVDEVTVNITLASNASIAMKELAEDRRHALAQGALCSNSALVNTYAQKTAAITERASVLFNGINNRVGWLIHHRP